MYIYIIVDFKKSQFSHSVFTEREREARRKSPCQLRFERQMVETMFLRPNDPEYNRPLIDLYASTHGFDAWQCPENITEMGLIKTLLVSKEGSPDEYEKFNQLSQFALDQYNDQQGTNFQFVKVLKANVEFSGSCIYYLTFQAEDTSSGAFENFQA
ncbi:hypothetical protein RHGRI_011784 [Rhododendron griersonianum]|uniref:Cystatin domain-containing protein n=1 Tax=Rhododendron griersonianum TaxID=479676 RepID=A0AAV6KP33_9ERIC|nr:hypothetical protein RHGRI_011784 [Rhododendron griersonianum]